MTGPTAPATDAGRRAWERLLARPESAALMLDFDGTLAPIVPDPQRAFVHPDAPAVLERLGTRLRAVAIVTGRPVEEVLRLGGFAGTPGLSGLRILGQYGVERWRAGADRIEAPPPPPGIAAARAELPELLEELGLGAVYVEDKGRALGVHVRRLPDPESALDRLRDPLERLAERHGLRLEPGRMVLELRGPGVDKGAAIRSLAEEVGAEVVVYAGDDLGDLPAYDAVEAMRSNGDRAGLLICPASDEQPALAARADLVVDGPVGLVTLLAELADALGS